jgi:catechol 2,3-dioxygenase-like lactoylglutathione lyase family enzyme
MAFATSEKTPMSEVCGIVGLFHVLVKTNDLQQTLRFYKGVVGLREALRPDFGFPGAWLACPDPVGKQIIHIWAEGPGMGPTGIAPYGTATIDHISLMAFGHKAYRERFRRHGLDWREHIIPKTTYWQLFVYDPSGVQLELTFDEANEGEPHGNVTPGHEYQTGENFFDRATYPRL